MLLPITKKTIWLLSGAMIVFVWSANALAQSYSTSPIPDSNNEIADIYFTPSNKRTLLLVYKDSALGRADIYKHLGITLLPVGVVTKALGISMTVNTDNQTAEGQLADGRKVMIIPAKNTALVGGVEKKQVPGLMFMHDGEIFIDNSVFVDVFGFTVYMNYSANTLRIVKETEETPPPAAPAVQEPTPTPAPTPTPEPASAPAPTTSSTPAPVKESKTVDTAVEHVTVSEPKTPKSPAAPATSVAPPVTGKEEALVMQLIIDDIEMEEFVEGFRIGDKLYLPLGQLTALVDFAINVDTAAKTAKGWFIREENTFVLTMDSATIKGETQVLPPNSVLTKDGDLFVDSDLLQRWFPLDFLMNRYNMTLLLNAREKLPFQEKLARKKSRDALSQKQAPKEITFKTVDIPYEPMTTPFVNMTFSPSYQSQTNEKRADYTIIAAGDLGYMTGHLYAGGDLNERVFSDLRLRVGQDDYTRTLLGPLGASSFTIGDINSIGLSQVTQSSSGRGFAVTNRASDRSDKFDVTSFIGDGTPGWEVELYRNSTLISSQTIGADGRYNFTDIPILFGNNTFRLVFFGPQGQVDEIVKNINASNSLLSEGDFTYNFSADQKNRTLFNIPDASSQDGGKRTTGEVEYGVTRFLTLTAGGAHTVLDDQEGYNYAAAGVRASLGGILLNLDNAYDVGNDGYSSRLAVFANLFDTDFRLQQKIAKDFISEEGDTSDPVERLSEIGFDRQAVVPLIGDMSAGLSLVRKTFESQRIDNLWVNRLSTSLYGISFTNSLQYNYDNQDTETLNGGFSLRGFYDRILLGGQIDYTVKPITQISTFKLTGNYPIDTDLSGNTSLIKYFQGDERAELENTVTMDMQKYRISMTGRADTNSNYYLGAALNMSFGKIPDSDNWMFSSKNMADTGTIIVKPYLDRNYNQQQDEDEEAPQNIAFKIGSQSVKNDGSGTLFATALPTNTPVAVRMDAEKQDNPFWTTGVDEYRIAPRPGRALVIDYPLFETSQIDGVVNVPSGSASALSVELINTEGQVVAGTRTAFDGYYLLQGIMPGAYTLRISEEQLTQRGLRMAEEYSVTIKASDFYIKDIVLTPQ